MRSSKVLKEYKSEHYYVEASFVEVPGHTRNVDVTIYTYDNILLQEFTLIPSDIQLLLDSIEYLKESNE